MRNMRRCQFCQIKEKRISFAEEESRKAGQSGSKKLKMSKLATNRHKNPIKGKTYSNFRDLDLDKF